MTATSRLHRSFGIAAVLALIVCVMSAAVGVWGGLVGDAHGSTPAVAVVAVVGAWVAATVFALSLATWFGTRGGSRRP